MFKNFVGIVLFVSTVIFGNTYYIDYSTGAHTNSGISKSTPWKLCPGMNGFSASYTHVPGDVFIFKGGVTWPAAALPFTIANSGTAGNTDTYTTDHTWYAGSAWAQPTFDGELFQKTLLYASEKNHVHINDLRFINAGMIAANGIIAFTFSNCSYFELSNNTFAPQSWGCLYVITERTGDFNDFFIHHNDISACAFGIRFVPGAASSIMHNVQVYNNNLHDFHSQLSGEVHGDGIQYYNTPDVAASFDRYIDGFKIFNNRFYGDFSQVSGSGGAMTALIYLSGASQGVEIYNNLFTPQYSGSQSPNFFESFISLRDNPNRGGHHKIYNNTFVTPVSGGQAAAILEDDTRYPSPALDIKNNIFSNFNWAFDLRSTNHTIDYNDEHFVNDMGKWAGNFVGSFANWQALGLDVHGISANPVFVSSSNYHLSQTSPCIGKGADLSAIVTTDIDGNTRPGSAGFSLGACEYGITPVVPAAPVLSAPVSGATDVAIAPALTWNPVSAATSYSVQLSTVSSFATTIVNQTGIPSTSYTASGLSNNSTYFWRVNATNANGAGNWSSPGHFTTVAGTIPCPIVLWWPSNSATGVVINPSLTWSEVPEALSYAVQISIVSDFATTIIHQTGITTSSYEANILANNTTYYWRVNVTNANGTSGWSSVFKFTVVKASNNAFLQDSGANGIVSIEAEHFMTNTIQSGHNWEKVFSAGYSGEGAMQALQNNGTSINTGYAVKSPRMDYSVTFVKTGKQYIWARGIGPSGSDDSYHAGIDGKETATCDRISSFTTRWRWSRTDTDGRAAYFNVSEKGEHTVNVWMREDGFIIDKIVISSNPNYVPTGTGPVESQKQKMDNSGMATNQSAQNVLDIFSCQKGVVHISLPFSGAYNLIVYALNGKKVHTFSQNNGSAGHNAVSLRGLNISRGFYILQLSVKGFTMNKKISILTNK